ncbi:MAG: DNA methyltransferase, partial [bacterium]|nr:DNA methyltransferase [bacterium]
MFETEVVEEVRKAKKRYLFDREIDLNADFKNLLIQGDCLSACAYLKSQDIKVDLVYIDPPFASGANYAKKIYLRNNGKSEIESDDNTIGEEIMYGDIWQKEDYLNWLYERLLAIRDVMSETGSIYVHLDWHIGHYVKILLDEVFGEENFVNEIVWGYSGGAVPVDKLPNKHDVIFWYSKSGVDWTYNPEYKSYSEKTQQRGRTAVKGKNAGLREEGTPITDWWVDIAPVTSPTDPEKQYYITQKPESLLRRIINLASNDSMIIADFFSGSGTTAKVANDLNRKFIACDIGINALQTTRDRLVKAGASFDILKIHDGLRLFRNPAQTTAKIFSII